jgi:hypothetical protein
MTKKSGRPSNGTNYQRVLINDIKRFRKGKHHDLMGKIMQDLRALEPGYAVRIPLTSINDVTVVNLRSAIIRAAAREKIKIITSSDDENFYAWKAD